MERIADSVYAATDMRGCNPGYVVTSGGVVVIDTPQLPTKAVAMREEILKKGPLRFLINTEHHIDHIFGDLFFAGLCPVIGHEHILDDFWTVSSGVDPCIYMKEAVAKDDPSGMSLLPSDKEMIVNPPAITFSHRLSLRVGDHIFELMHLPGHTVSVSGVYLPKERIVFASDCVFSRRLRQGGERRGRGRDRHGTEGHAPDGVGLGPGRY